MDMPIGSIKADSGTRCLERLHPGCWSSGSPVTVAGAW